MLFSHALMLWSPIVSHCHQLPSLLQFPFLYRRWNNIWRYVDWSAEDIIIFTSGHRKNEFEKVEQCFHYELGRIGLAGTYRLCGKLLGYFLPSIVCNYNILLMLCFF